MPNHCANSLVVTGPDAELRKFAKAAQGLKKDGQAFDLERFFPMPKELEGIHCGGATINGKSVTSWRKDAQGNNIEIPEWELKSMMKRFGATNSYGWHCKVLGTKWGVYEVTSHYRAGILTYGFQSAWSPFNIGVFEKIVSLFPKLKFTMKFAEQGSGYYGFYGGAKGEVTGDGGWDTKDKLRQGKDGEECYECGQTCGEDCYGHWDLNLIGDQDFIDLLECSG